MSGVLLVRGNDRYSNVKRSLELLEEEISTEIKGKERILVKPNFVTVYRQLAVDTVGANLMGFDLGDIGGMQAKIQVAQHFFGSTGLAFSVMSTRAFRLVTGAGSLKLHLGFCCKKTEKIRFQRCCFSKTESYAHILM